MTFPGMSFRARPARPSEEAPEAFPSSRAPTHGRPGPPPRFASRSTLEAKRKGRGDTRTCVMARSGAAATKRFPRARLKISAHRGRQRRFQLGLFHVPDPLLEHISLPVEKEDVRLDTVAELPPAFIGPRVSNIEKP